MLELQLALFTLATFASVLFAAWALTLAYAVGQERAENTDGDLLYAVMVELQSSRVPEIVREATYLGVLDVLEQRGWTDHAAYLDLDPALDRVLRSRWPDPLEEPTALILQDP